jgi:hypothetical protein
MKFEVRGKGEGSEDGRGGEKEWGVTNRLIEIMIQVKSKHESVRSTEMQGKLERARVNERENESPLAPTASTTSTA